ncbi:biotin carboxylase N-terminal domain-containing protein, partial [Bacillus mycoides]|uniref:biotin carboxylase N-terminal domain-containing protein n=1 Tax=Bacillus mycoides TaxID=1405 RepID=UPI0023575F42
FLIIKKLLIPNPPQIPLPIIPPSKHINIQTLPIYSQPHKQSLHLQIPHEPYSLPPTISKQTYFNFTNIISLPKLTRCHAIHPGYPFLAQNPD